MRFFDTHTHLNDPAFEGDFEIVVTRALQSNVKGFMIVGYDLETSERAIRLAEYLPWSHASVGIHPHEASSFNQSTLKRLRTLAKNENVVAIGEVGLDFHKMYSEKEEQIHAFREQLKLAKELDLPVILHIRKSFPEVFKILEEEGISKGVFHCFSGGHMEAQKAVDMGFFVSFAGSITYGSSKLEKALKSIPLNRVLIETDCPYLAPKPYKGERNEPSYILYTAEKMAEVLGLSVKKIADVTFHNALNVFSIEYPSLED